MRLDYHRTSKEIDLFLCGRGTMELDGDSATVRAGGA
jgi:mannose-6-phosphate isomerase-like protein (cupin superfamily)